MLIWFQFVALAAIIFFSGSKLLKYGDIIAEKTGLGRTWIGVILMASVTSLPELITGISSVTLFELPNITVGDILGSCMFNILIITLLDALAGSVPISTKVHEGHVLSASFGIFLLGLVGITIFVGAKFPAIGWISIYSLIFIVIYFVAIRLIFSYEKTRIAKLVKEIAEELQYKDIPKSRAYKMYALNAVIVIGAATYLPHIGEEIAKITGLGQTFVGSIFIAISTSLPEVVVTIAAARIGAVDLAVGNLFGSNLFNILILALDDIFYTKGPILSYVSENHIFTTFSAIMMTAIVIIGLTYRASKKPLFLAWDSIGILIGYFITTLVLYTMR
ncbi:MAG: sodium:calcium antiporter [Deltaproteobacteria bacterium]|nr:sodium:calcium antiporter [Deltaproteobacteria bacterium]